MSKKSYDLVAAFQSETQLADLSLYDYVCATFTQVLEDKKLSCDLIKKIVSITVVTIVVLAASGGVGFGIYCE